MKRIVPKDQAGLFASTVDRGDWRPVSVAALPTWPVSGRVAIDIETRDEQLRTLGPGVRRGGYIVGYSFAIEDGPAYYVPLRHAGGNVEDPAAAMRYFADQAAAFRGTLVGAGMQYDLDYLAEAGVAFSPAAYFDVQVADPLIFELHDAYDLDSMCVRRGLEGKDERHLRDAAAAYGIDPKKDLWRLNGQHAEAYGIGDVLRPLAIARKQERDIEENSLDRVFRLESRLLPVLVKMRRRGVRIDQDKLQQIDDFAAAEALKACQEIGRLLGRTVAPADVMAKEAIGPLLAGMGRPVDMASIKSEQIDKAVLEAIDHPAAALLVRARKMRKLSTTYVNSLRKHMVNGRIHATFNQLKGSNVQDPELEGTEEESGVRFGRISSCDPNLLNQPMRDEEIGSMWRSVYIPDEGKVWAAADARQQEPRVLTHFAELCGCTGAKEFGDRYRTDPTFDTYDGLVQLTRIKRNETKQTYLGVSYGMGGPKLCKRLKKPTVWVTNREGKLVERAGPEGQSIMDAFHLGAPFIRELSRKIERRIQEVGKIKTPLGRTFHFPERPPHLRRRPDEKYDWAHKGLNRLVQGTSADVGKTAMVNTEDAGIPMQIQVYDEQDASVRDQAEAQQMADIMRDAMPLRVPMQIELGVGSSWGDAK